MRPPVFIGDEVSAAGFRLGGAEVYVPDPGEVRRLFERIRNQADLVLITAETATEIPAADLREAMTAARPLILVIADIRGRAQPPDLAMGLRQQLGMAE